MRSGLHRPSVSCAAVFLGLLWVVSPAIGVECISEVYICVDVSGSMSSELVRIESGLSASVGDTSIVPHDGSVRVGLTVFNDGAHGVMELTPVTPEDLAFILEQIDRISTFGPGEGTDIGAGIAGCRLRLGSEGTSENQYILLVSDGEETQGNWVREAQAAANEGIRICCVGDGVLEQIAEVTHGRHAWHGWTQVGTSVNECMILISGRQLGLVPEWVSPVEGSTHEITAVALSGLTPFPVAPGVPVDFEVISGPNTGDSATVVTDGEGMAVFSYLGDGGHGVDLIEARMADPGDAVEVIAHCVGADWYPSDPCEYSEFGVDAEGWLIQILNVAFDLMPETYVPTYEPSGGNPGGCIQQSDPSSNREFWSAPEVLLDYARYSYGHDLSFDLRINSPTLPQPFLAAQDVILIGVGNSLSFDCSRPAESTWVRYSIPLVATEDWIDRSTGSAPSDSTMMMILSDLEYLLIRAEYWWGSSGPDVTRLDNIRIGCDPPCDIPLESDFSSDAEDWTVQLVSSDLDSLLGGYEPTYADSGGAPGGYIAQVDAGEHVEYWSAPALYRVNALANYGEGLGFDLVVNQPEGGAEYDNDHDVILIGGGTWIVYDQPSRPWADVWTAHTVPLIEGPGWVNKATGLEPTQAEMQAVLGSLQHLLIRAEFWQGETEPEDTGLDNVRLGCAVIAGVPEGSVVEEAPVSLETLARPTPSAGRVAIQYEVPHSGLVRIRVFDLRGTLVKDLWSGWQELGSHVQHWDGTTDSGQRVAAGVYFYRVEAGDLEGNGKILLLR